MVKANGYGHGLTTIYNCLHNYVDFFGVSNINEAEQLYKLNKDIKVLIVGKTNNFLSCAKHGFSFIIESITHFSNLIKFIKKNPDISKCIKIHIKINCGMNRLGIKTPLEFRKLYEKALKFGIKVEGISCHFSSGDSNSKIFNQQNNRFNHFLDQIPKRENPIISVGGSGIIYQKLLGKNISFDMARLGIILYGYGPKNLKLRPALKIISHIIKIYNVKAGEYIGYGTGFKAQNNLTVGIIPLGYGDGICRGLSNKFSVYVGKKKAKSIGFICMDMFFVDLTGIDAVEGQKVVVFKDAKKWAQILGTIEYEILTNFRLLR